VIPPLCREVGQGEVCLDKIASPWEGGSSRLWSLLDLIELKVKEIAQLIFSLQGLEAKYIAYLATGQGYLNIGCAEEDIILRIIASAKPELNTVEMVSSLDCIHIIESRFATCRPLGISSYTYIEINTAISGLLNTILRELDRHKYVYINNDNVKYFEQDKLFGDDVYDAFLSIRDEIKDAGNCLAAELYTACVFHLMRVAEYGLRALAKERGVTLKHNKPIEYGEWGTIIRGIEKTIEPIENKAQAGPEKDAALAFYHGAIGEFRAFKDVYRNPAMHPRKRYDKYEAASAMQHVLEFMKKLSNYVTEKTKKSINWKLKYTP